MDLFLLLALSLENREELSALENELEKDISWCEQRGGWEKHCQAQRQWDTATVHHLASPLLRVLCLLILTGVTGLIPGSKRKVWAGCQWVIEEWLAATSVESCWRALKQNWQTRLWLSLCLDFSMNLLAEANEIKHINQKWICILKMSLGRLQATEAWRLVLIT